MKWLLEIVTGVSNGNSTAAKAAAAANWGWVLPTLVWLHTNGNDKIHIDFVLTVWTMTFIVVGLFFVIELVRRLLCNVLQLAIGLRRNQSEGKPHE